MNMLVLANTQTGGEWIATFRYLQDLKLRKPETQLHLISYCNDSATSKYQEIFQTVQEIYPAFAYSPFSFAKKIIKDILQLRTEINKKFRDLPIQQVYCANYLMVLAFYAIPSLWNFPFTYAYHGRKSSIIRMVNDLNYREILTKILEFWALLVAQKIVTPANAGKLQITQQLGLLTQFKQIEIIPNVLPVEFYQKPDKEKLVRFAKKNGLTNSTKKILYCGRIAKHKGLESLMKAFTLLINQIPEVMLIFAYPSENVDKQVLEYILSEIKNNGLEKKVKFIKDLQQTELIFLYHLVNLVVLPSEIEIAPLVIDEALACDTPFITSTIADTYNIAKHSNLNLTLQHITADEINQKIITFFSLPSYQRKLTIEMIKETKKKLQYKYQ